MIHRSYAIWWAVIWAFAPVLELLGVPDWAFGIWVGVFMTVEVVAAFVRQKRGDTWSEMAWFIGGEKKAKRALVTVLTTYIGWRAYALMPFAVAPDWVGPGILLCAFIVWIIPHIWLLGRHG